MDDSAATQICPTCGTELVADLEAAMTDQARDPRGTPNGGQFAALLRRESPVALNRPVEGTFLFPPPMRTAAEAIEFWTQVAIPDQALARMHLEYRNSVGKAREEWAAPAWSWHERDRWLDQNPRPPSDAHPEALAEWKAAEKASEDAYARRLQERLGTMPEELDRTDARPLFRAAAMLLTAYDGGLPRTERRKVADHVLEFAAGPRSVADAAVETGLVGIATRFVTPENYDRDGDGVIDQPGFDWDRHQRIVKKAVADVVLAATLAQSDHLNVAQRRTAEDHDSRLDDALDELHEGHQTIAQTVLDVNDPGPKRRRRR